MQTAGIGSLLLIIEFLMNLAIDFLLFLLVKHSIGRLTQNTGHTTHNAIDPAHRATVHIIDTFRMVLMLLVGQGPVA